MTKLDAALALARRGFKLFPITPGAKFPPLVSNWPALATSDERLISMQWGPSGTPEANIGIHCEGLVVIDVDTKKGGKRAFDLLRLTEDLPATLCTNTPSGGEHHFYRLPADHPGTPNSVDVLGAGLDIRSHAGYVVAPGSVVERGAYSFADAAAEIARAPDWLLQRLGQRDALRAPVDHDVSGVPDAPDASVERAREWLRTAERSVKGQGGDQAAYRVACKLRDLGMSYEQACELMRSEAWDYGCGWRDGRLEEKPIRSAYRYAQNEEGGGRGVVEDDLPVPAALPPETAKPKKRSRIVQADDFADEDDAGAEYVVKNLLYRGSHAQAYGPPGAGKSFVMLDVAYHVANGKPWMNLAVREGPVLYLAFEGYGGLRKRVRALRKKYDTKIGPLYLVDASMNLREQAGRQELGQILAEMPAPPALIIIDTFARAMMGGDENSAQDTGAFNDAVAKLIGHTGACVVAIHHSGKNKAAGARGSSAILGALDTELEIDYGAVRPSKQRDVELLPAIPFKLRPVPLGEDRDGEALTSCVVEPGQAVPERSKPLSGKGEHAFMVLCEMTGDENKPVARTLFVRKLVDEGFGRSSAHEWARKLERAGKATIEDDYVTRKMT